MPPVKKLPTALEPYKIKKGEVRNPKGKGKGVKTARAIVKDFMDKGVDNLPTGKKVSRFQFLLWSMYEMNFRLVKQVDYRKKEITDAENRLKLANINLPLTQKEFDRCEKLSETVNDKMTQKERENISSAFYKAQARLNANQKEIQHQEKQIRKRNTEYEKLMVQVLEANGKTAEFLQKSSGQYIESKQVTQISDQPIHISAGKKDLQIALDEINDEL